MVYKVHNKLFLFRNLLFSQASFFFKKYDFILCDSAHRLQKLLRNRLRMSFVTIWISLIVSTEFFAFIKSVNKLTLLRQLISSIHNSLYDTENELISIFIFHNFITLLVYQILFTKSYVFVCYFVMLFFGIAVNQLLTNCCYNS